jgi:hypothetical protein
MRALEDSSTAPGTEQFEPGRLPAFVAIGPPRSATTWLDEVMRGHVGLPRNRKETDFFTRNYFEGLSWYRAYFRDYPADVVCGEICPNYFSSAQARERIAGDLPGVKLIVTLRDPVARAYSIYRLLRSYAWEKRDFESALAARAHISETNRYATHLRAWFAAFGRDRVLVCFHEELQASPQGFVDRICDFIGAARFQLEPAGRGGDRVNGVERAPRNRRLARNARNLRLWLEDHDWYHTVRSLEHAGVWRFCFERGEEFEPLSPELDARIRARYLPEIDELEKLLQRDLGAWKAPHRRE